MKRPAQMTQDMAARQAQRQAQYMKMANMTPTQQAKLWLKAVTTPTYATTTATYWTTPSNFTSGTGTTVITPPVVWYTDEIEDGSYIDQTMLRVFDGQERHILLPDKTVIHVEKDGSFRIEDANALVTYRANRIRDFNPFLNASDKLEAFIKFCGEQGVRQKEMLDIPIKLFIGWLIMEAALADKEPAPQQALLDDLKKRLRPRCRCGRFLARKLAERNVMFCRPVCLEKELAIS